MEDNRCAVGRERYRIRAPNRLIALGGRGHPDDFPGCQILDEGVGRTIGVALDQVRCRTQEGHFRAVRRKNGLERIAIALMTVGSGRHQSDLTGSQVLDENIPGIVVVASGEIPRVAGEQQLRPVGRQGEITVGRGERQAGCRSRHHRGRTRRQIAYIDFTVMVPWVKRVAAQQVGSRAVKINLRAIRRPLCIGSKAIGVGAGVRIRHSLKRGGLQIANVDFTVPVARRHADDGFRPVG